jgi:hypothetical protein
MKPSAAGRPLILLLLLAVAVARLGAGAEPARGEQTQRGTLISSLDGELRPLRLPRDRAAPVAVHLEGRLRTADGSLVPRVTRFELGLPVQGVLATRGLPVCPPRRLRNTKTAAALAACRPALIGRGSLTAVVVLPNQSPFPVHARLLAFNTRIGKRRGVLLHAGAANPPTASVLPLLVRRGAGRFGTALVGDISPALGPWPRLERFELTLFRRFRHERISRSYLSASCPVPQSLTAGFFSFARVAYGFAGGSKIATAITRGCRAR